MRLLNRDLVVRTKASAPCMHQMLKAVAYRPRKRTAGREGQSKRAPTLGRPRRIWAPGRCWGSIAGCGTAPRPWTHAPRRIPWAWARCARTAWWSLATPPPTPGPGSTKVGAHHLRPPLHLKAACCPAFGGDASRWAAPWEREMSWRALAQELWASFTQMPWQMP